MINPKPACSQVQYVGAWQKLTKYRSFSITLNYRQFLESRLQWKHVYTMYAC